MPVKYVYASLYFIGIFLLARGIHGYSLPPMAHIAFGLSIIFGAASIQLSEKK